MSPIPRRVSISSPRATLSLKSSSTALSLRFIAMGLRSGRSIHARSSRPPIGVFVLSSTHRSEPRFSPVRSDSVSSSERRVAQSSSMYLPPVNRSMRRMCAMSVFCVSLIYRKSAPAADTAAGASPSPASSIEERPNCSHTRAPQAMYS